MWAKVGRKELCQWWRSFWVSDERRGFEVGAIEMRAVWRAELRGGAWDASFCGEKRGCPSRALCGERGGFSGLAEGMRPRKGDLSYRRGMEG